MSVTKLAAAYARQELEKPDFIQRMHEQHAALFEYATYMKGTNIKEICLVDGDVIMTTRSSGIRMYVDVRDHRSIPVEMLNFGDHEPEEMGLCLDIFGSMDCLLDIGANVGWFSLECTARRPDMQIHAFEPLPVTHAQLARNIALNSATNVTLHTNGFSDEAGDVTFYFYPEGLGNTSMQDLSERDSVESATCTVLRLDDFVRERGIAPDCIKCDVEGAELLVLKGGLEAIGEHKPAMFLELLRKWSAKFGYHPRDVVSLLEPLGYGCFAANGARLEKLAGPADMDTTEATNFFFLHTEKHAGVIARLA